MTIRSPICPQIAFESAPIVEVAHSPHSLVVRPISFVKGHVSHPHHHR